MKKEKGKVGRPRKQNVIQPKRKDPNIVIKKTKDIKRVDNVELTKEIIISKGKGKLTKEAEDMILKLTNNLIRKFTYSNADDLYDCKMSGYCAILEAWMNFNEAKYENAFPYLTEVCKRGIVAGLNELTQRNKADIISLSKLIHI